MTKNNKTQKRNAGNTELVFSRGVNALGNGRGRVSIGAWVVLALVVVFALLAQSVSAQTVTGVTPQVGSSAGNEIIEISGNNFASVVDVKFGTESALSITTVVGGGDDVLQVTTPPQAPGAFHSVSLNVKFSGGESISAGIFTYFDQPTLTALTPDEGASSGGDTVSIFGSNLGFLGGFISETVIKFGGIEGIVTGIGVNGNFLGVEFPPHAPGLVDVTIETPGGTDTLNNAFTFIAQPQITEISPNEGATSGGDLVQIIGTDLTTEVPIVLFDSSPGTVVGGLVDGTLLAVQIPPHAPGLVDVTVSNTGGTDTLFNAFTYIGPPAPVEICGNREDEDGDGLVDCADTEDCPAGTGPCEATELTCGDRFDNDADGKTDCADTDCASAEVCTTTLFIRGEVNQDMLDLAGSGGNAVNLFDALYLLDATFRGGAQINCRDAADVNNDGQLNGLIDALYILNFIFASGNPEPPAPFDTVDGANPDDPFAINLPYTLGPDPLVESVPGSGTFDKQSDQLGCESFPLLT